MKMFSELYNEHFPRQEDPKVPWYNQDVPKDKRIYEPADEPTPEPKDEPADEPVPEPKEE